MTGFYELKEKAEIRAHVLAKELVEYCRLKGITLHTQMHAEDLRPEIILTVEVFDHEGNSITGFATLNFKLQKYREQPK